MYNYQSFEVFSSLNNYNKMRKIKYYGQRYDQEKEKKVRKELGEGFFHGWGCDYTWDEDGNVNYSTAIIELEDGTIENVRVDDVQFVIVKETEIDHKSSVEEEHEERLREWSNLVGSNKVEVDINGIEYFDQVIQDGPPFIGGAVVRKCRFCEVEIEESFLDISKQQVIYRRRKCRGAVTL